MIAYLDSSVILRIVLRQPNALKEWRSIARGVASALVEVSKSVLSRAAQPFPTMLGTLDAIHLATAMLWKDHSGLDLVMATHDEALAAAAKACGLRLVGS